VIGQNLNRATPGKSKKTIFSTGAYLALAKINQVFGYPDGAGKIVINLFKTTVISPTNVFAQNICEILSINQIKTYFTGNKLALPGVCLQGNPASWI